MDEELFDDEEPCEPVTDGPLAGKIVKVTGFGAVACHVVADDGEDFATVVLVGDDRRHRVDRDRCTEIPRKDYCGECGQIGCAHDGYDREEEDDGK